MKICTQCKEHKEDTEFHKNNRAKSGLASICKRCHAALRTKWYKERKFAEVDLEKTTKICRLCHTEKPLLEFHKNAALKHGRSNECKTCNTQAVMDRYAERMITKEGQATKLVNDIRQRAKKKNLPVDIDAEYIMSIMPEMCPVLNIQLQRNQGVQADNSFSVDRIVPALGYVKGNVIIVSYRANRIRNDATIDELEAVASFYKTLLCDKQP